MRPHGRLPGGLRTSDLSKHFSRSAMSLRAGGLGLPFLGRKDEEPLRAVEGVSLEVAEGTVLGLLGRNGAGKTTFVKLLATLIDPTRGDAWVSGFSIRTAPRAVRGCLGLAAGTERGFYFRLTGRQNLRFFGALHGIPPELISRRMADALERLGLTAAADRLYMLYSSGMRRRLDLARVMICDPPVLLLDEPTASLDPASADRIRAVIADERGRGKTVILVTHNLFEAERLCDRVAILEQGRLRVEGTLGQLRRGSTGCTVDLTVSGDEDALGKLVAAIAGGPGVRGSERDRSGVRVSLEDRNALAPLLGRIAASGVAVTGIAARDQTLEEIFRDVTETEASGDQASGGDDAMPASGDGTPFAPPAGHPVRPGLGSRRRETWRDDVDGDAEHAPEETRR